MSEVNTLSGTGALRTRAVIDALVQADAGPQAASGQPPPAGGGLHPAEPPASPCAQSPALLQRLVVVDDSPGAGASADGPGGGQAERRRLSRRLDDAALVAVRGPTRGLAALLLATGAIGLLQLRQAAVPGATSTAAGLPVAVPGLVVLASLLLLALALLAWAARPQWGHRLRVPALLGGVGLSALAVGALAWSADPAQRAPLAALATVFGLAAAALLAPLRHAGWAALPAPLVASAAAATAAPGGAAWWGVGLVAGVMTAWVAQHAHQSWRQQMKTFLAQAERLVQLARDCSAAQRADQDKRRLLGIASHDLRQPVHAIGLFAATLHRRLQQSPEEPLARNLTRAVDGLERSFNAILDISRLDGGALVPRPQTFLLRDMFRRLHMQYGGQAELAGLGLRFSPGGKSVTTDPQLLERIVGNLVQNAIKYTTHGGIVVVARNTRSHLNLEIWDTGSGIAPHELPRIFDEFYQIGLGERDRTHGLGMGLAIVKRLIALLGHRLEVASVPGRGTMFRIGLPIGSFAGIEEDMAPADTLPMTSHTPKTVLVVDDEEPIREGLQLLLQEWGYQVMTAANAEQADLAVNALEGHIDLVLSDLHLGDGEDGQQVIANVRRLCGHEVPAILVTGETMVDEVQRLTASADPVLFKPVQPRRLYEAMRAALGTGLP